MLAVPSSLSNANGEPRAVAGRAASTNATASIREEGINTERGAPWVGAGLD
jgi:hypothetical protein